MYNQLVSFSVECFATISATGDMTDYGVPGSPRWIEYEPQDWADITIEIAGVDVVLKELPKVLRDALWDAAMENLDDNGEWK